MKSIKKTIRDHLLPLYSAGETESITNLILEHVTGLSRLELFLHQDNQLPDAKIMQIMDIVNRLANHEPIQYILGTASFYGLSYRVDGSVLIPRTETEELVDWIIRDEKEHCKRLLDIGTGSGCIPITIDLHTSMEHVEGWDISEDALATARLNATSLNSRVVFSRQDIFAAETGPEIAKWDVIVSNPPYVLAEESQQMQKNVLDFEPHVALFVPDKDPLLFFRAIAGYALRQLEPGGKLYFEINERFREDIIMLLTGMGFGPVETRQDLQGKDRMVRAALLR